MDIHKIAAKHSQKTITKAELAEYLGCVSDEELFKQINDGISEGSLVPIKNSGTNGNARYSLYMKYRLIRQEDDHSAELSEIKALHILLQKNGVLAKKPQLYAENREMLCALSTYLFKRSPECVPVSRKERSFEIFGEEKQLDDAAFRNLLKRLGVTDDDLRLYDTPVHCFYDYIPLRKNDMTLLICENKDIWFDLRRMMSEYGAHTLWNTYIDGVIYGGGNNVTEKTGALTEYTRFLGVDKVRFLYWGDIDREGINIFLRLCRANPSLEISLFVAGYIEMLHRAETMKIPQSADKRNKTDDHSEVLRLFSEADRKLLCDALDSNKRIPQEIISFSVLLEEMR